MKKCYSCKIEKLDSEFNVDKSKKDGLNIYCRSCRKEKREENKDLIAEKDRLKYINNREAKLEYQKNYYEENKIEVKNSKKKYYENNNDYVLEHVCTF
jgi:hypothetical protein